MTDEDKLRLILALEEGCWERLEEFNQTSTRYLADSAAPVMTMLVQCKILKDKLPYELVKAT